MAAAKPAINKNRKSKAEVQQEFGQIKDQVAEEQRETDTRHEELAKLKEVETREAVEGITVESVVQKISNLGIDLSKALSDVSHRLVTGTSLLATLREAVFLERKEIERLHKIDIATTSLSLLVEEYDLRKADLESEASLAQRAWDQELDRREKDQKDYDETIKRVRTREKEEYEYQKNLERKKDQTEYEEAQRLQERKNKEKQEQLEKTWQAREVSIKEREEELARLKKETSEYPEKLKKEIEKAVAEATKILDQKHHQALVFQQKDMETDKKLAELKIKSLEETVTRQFTQIESLSQRLEEAKGQVQDIAIKAIEGASGSRALNHVNQIAMEQAKTRSNPPS